MSNDKTISTLNNLIETCKDGELGFKTAAEGLKSTQIKQKFFGTRVSAPRWCVSFRPRCAGWAAIPRSQAA